MIKYSVGSCEQTISSFCREDPGLSHCVNYLPALHSVSICSLVQWCFSFRYAPLNRSAKHDVPSGQ